MYLCEPQGYWGLTADVAFRIELGVAFVDDGDRLFSMSPELMYGVVEALGDERPTAPIEEQLRRFPTVFTRFSSRDEALASLIEES